MTLEEMLNQVRQLSLVDKVRLIEQVAPEIERELATDKPSPRKSLWGLCTDLGVSPSVDEINQARQEE